MIQQAFELHLHLPICCIALYVLHFVFFLFSGHINNKNCTKLHIFDYYIMLCD